MKIAPDYHNLRKLSEDKKYYVKKLFGNAGVEKEITLKVFFDDTAITESGCRSPDEWSNKGLYIPLHAGYHEMPVRISDMFDWREYEHFIWIRNDICAREDNDIDFSWTLAHELRHFEQDVKSHALSLLGKFLCDALPNISDYLEKHPEGIPIIEVPRERDADLYAWGRVRDLFEDKNLIDKYMRQDKSLVYLLGCDPNSPCDVKQETIAVVERCRPILNEIAEPKGFDLEHQLDRLKKC